MEKDFAGSADSAKPNIDQASLANGQISSIDLATYYEENAGSEFHLTLLRLRGTETMCVVLRSCRRPRVSFCLHPVVQFPVLLLFLLIGVSRRFQRSEGSLWASHSLASQVVS